MRRASYDAFSNVRFGFLPKRAVAQRRVIRRRAALWACPFFIRRSACLRPDEAVIVAEMEAIC
jgi:hypothetical protein